MLLLIHHYQCSLWFPLGLQLHRRNLVVKNENPFEEEINSINWWGRWHQQHSFPSNEDTNFTAEVWNSAGRSTGTYKRWSWDQESSCPGCSSETRIWRASPSPVWWWSFKIYVQNLPESFYTSATFEPTWNVTVTWNDIFVHSVERDLMILLIWRDTHEHILVLGHINVISVKNLSLKDVHLKVIVWKFMELRINMTTNKEDLRCMFVKTVDTQPRNQKSTTYTWRKTILTPRLFWNSTTSDTLNSTIPTLLVCYSNVVHKCACWLFQ